MDLKRMHDLWLASICALCALQLTAAVAQSAPNLDALQKRLDETNAELISLIRQPLLEFSKESPTSCTSKNLGKALSYARLLLKLVHEGTISLGPRELLDLGAIIVDTADAARNASCKDDARALYDYVIATFADAKHAPIRRRAEIAIQHLGMP
jgi:hypothetical protein